MLFRSTADQAQQVVEAIIKRERALARYRVEVANVTYVNARTLTLSLLAVGLLVSVAFALYVARSIVGSGTVSSLVTPGRLGGPV